MNFKFLGAVHPESQDILGLLLEGRVRLNTAEDQYTIPYVPINDIIPKKGGTGNTTYSHPSEKNRK